MTFEQLSGDLEQWLSFLMKIIGSSEFYLQIGIIGLVYFAAYLLARQIEKSVPALNEKPAKGSFEPFRNLLIKFNKVLFPLFAIILLKFSVAISQIAFAHNFLLVAAETIAILLILNTLINLFVAGDFAQKVFKWVAIPLMALHLLGLLDDITAYLEGISLEAGNIKITANALARVIIFGSFLFWLGRVSNSTGQRIIRSRETWDMTTREIFSKLFQVGLVVVISLLLLQVMGINFTTLAVFGGALGVGLGFGLQAIASNFISGIIILLDRSISVGDYVELEDGRKGIIRELNMRSTTLETFDGKDIMVPNEKFIVTSFTNWTHLNKKQRYSVEFSVAYKTDIRKLVAVIKETVARHPQVLSGEDLPFEERPDVEIQGFGDSGINMFVEFWMEGIDDGKNRVGGDLLLMIYETMLEHGFEIPFPQREVRVLNKDTLEIQSIKPDSQA